MRVVMSLDHAMQQRAWWVPGWMPASPYKCWQCSDTGVWWAAFFGSSLVSLGTYSVHARTWFNPGTMIKSSGKKMCWYTEVFVSESDRVVVMHGEYHRSAKHSEREASLRRGKWSGHSDFFTPSLESVSFDHANHVTTNVVSTLIRYIQVSGGLTVTNPRVFVWKHHDRIHKN